LTPAKTKNNREQKLVDELFDNQATYWRDTYKAKDIQAIIYQQRQMVALKYIDGLALSKSAHVLEIGCGAGFMTTALAKRGFTVEAIDHVQAMIELTQEHARQEGVKNRIKAHIGDINELSYEDQFFNLIVALGVFPWLRDSQRALTEVLRTLAAGGYVILSIDNAYRLTTLLDPLTFPPFALIRFRVRKKLEKKGLLASWNPSIDTLPYKQHSIREFNKNLNEAGLTIINSTSVGFGPFSFFGHYLFSERLGTKINLKLQVYADKRYPIFRTTGSQYIVLATKTH
jgi:ubiquinone/menaquinone biosynthesis C-methylase UbiE